ncbi:MAG: OmpH family outer membrane protein [Planctomycetota bacterium]|nr:OmpH family outer membrane protein [Planctomycetota bacterium]
MKATRPLTRELLTTVRVAILCLAGLAAIAAVVPSQPAVIATVNSERLWDNIDASQAIEARRVRLQADLAGRLDKVQAELKELQDDLESFAPGTDTFNAAAKAALAKTGELRALEGFAEIKMDAEKSTAMRELYAMVKGVAATLAEEQNIDIVFVDDAAPAIRSGDLAQTMEQASGRRMLYANASLDITDLLTQRVNAELKARAGG